MPKRRMTAARRRQIEEWQQAGVRARFNRVMPQGKTVLLYHHTTPQKAAKIVKSGFKPPSQKWIQNARKQSGISDVVWFHDRKHHNIFAKFAGPAVLTVKVPRKLITRRKLGVGDELMVRHKDLAGRKVKRIK